MAQQHFQIQYLPHSQINKQKWDACIESAENGLIYGQSIYLDAMAINWDAIILNNYEAVWPLTWKKKLGICYIYQPWFIPQGGVFSAKKLSSKVMEQFLAAIPAKFKYIDFYGNELNEWPASSQYQLREKTNFVLPLYKNYESLSSAYSNDAKKNLRRAEKFSLKVQSSENIADVIKLYRNQYGNLNKNVTKRVYERLEELAKRLLKRKEAFCCEVLMEGEVIAAALFWKDSRRIYYILGAPTERGRACKAIHFLIDAIIKQFAGTSLVFDFEGSSIPTVAAFYIKFSPEKKMYGHLIWNRLPMPLRWLKK